MKQRTVVCSEIFILLLPKFNKSRGLPTFEKNTQVKTIGLLLIQLLFFVAAQAQDVNYNPNAKKDTTKKSIKCAAVGKIGNANIRINYYSPGVRGRIIWGGVVPMDEVWVTGAHAATNIEIDKPFVIAGKKIPAGTYAIFTIPSNGEWTFILNKNYQQHLTDEYDAKDDLVRLKIKPISSNSITERLQYSIEANKLAIAWEKISIEIPLTVQ